MKRCICWWVCWVLVTSEVTRHLRDISGNLDITRIQEPNYWHHPRSPKITLDLFKFGRIPDCARIAAWAGLPGSWIHLDAGRILLQPVMGPEGSDVYSYRLR